MGNAFSSPSDVRGTSTSGGKATSEFRKRRREWEKESDESMLFLSDLLDWSNLDEADGVAATTPQPPRQRSVQKQHLFETFDDNGNCIPLFYLKKTAPATLWSASIKEHG
jgi:hypothetical protein